MNPCLARALMHLGRPLRAFNCRYIALERLLDCVLNEQEVASVMDACQRAGRSFGAYYHWKLEQIALIATLRSLGKEETHALTRRKDRTDYTLVDTCLDDPRGLLVAIPHHGHFVLSIIALCVRLRHHRDVFVFYEPPEAHATNEIFDVIHERLFGVDDIRVGILHNNRAGIARAIKELRAGQVVIIMPDVYKNVNDTYYVPFCDAHRGAMLGTATIARRTGARILPMVSQPGSSQLEFASVFGALVEPRTGNGTPEGDTHADFRTTMALYRQFEPFMHDQLLFWQYVRGHIARERQRPSLTLESLQIAGPMFLKDPRVTVDLHSPILLDATT